MPLAQYLAYADQHGDKQAAKDLELVPKSLRGWRQIKQIKRGEREGSDRSQQNQCPPPEGAEHSGGKGQEHREDNTIHGPRATYNKQLTGHEFYIVCAGKWLVGSGVHPRGALDLKLWTSC